MLSRLADRPTARPVYPQYAGAMHFTFYTRGGTNAGARADIVPGRTLIGQAFVEAHESFGEPQIPRSRSTASATGSSGCRASGRRPARASATSRSSRSRFTTPTCSAGALLARVGTTHRASQEALDAGARRDASTAARDRTPTAPGSTVTPRSITGSTTSTPDTTSTASSATSTAPATPRSSATCGRGFEYFKTHFFEPDGRPKYYARPDTSDRHPVRGAGDRHADVLFRRGPAALLPLAIKVADWTIDQHAGSGRPLLLSGPRLDEDHDADAPLGAGHDVQGARASFRQARTLAPSPARAAS